MSISVNQSNWSEFKSIAQTLKRIHLFMHDVKVFV